MPRKRKAKRPRLIDVLPSLVKMVPEVRLERIENVYPVFEKRTVCLKRDRISFQNTPSHETQKITSDSIARVSLQKAARLEKQKVVTIDNTPTVSLQKAARLEKQKVVTIDNTSTVSLQKSVTSEHQKAAANYNTARVYLQKTTFLDNQRVMKTDNTGKVNLQKTACVENPKVAATDSTARVYSRKTDGPENQKVASTDSMPKIYVRKTADLENLKLTSNDNSGVQKTSCLENQKVAATDSTSRIGSQKTAGLANHKVAANENTPKIYLQKTAYLENQKQTANDNTAGVNDSDDDVNDDALFEYEVDLENLSRDVMIKTEIIKDDRQDAVVVVNLVPEVRPDVDQQEEAVMNITSDANPASEVPTTNTEAGQSCQDMNIQAYSLDNGAGAPAASSTKGNAEKQESDDDDIMVLLDTSEQESENRKQPSDIMQQQSGGTKELSVSSEQESDSKPGEGMSILSTSWALADCVSAKLLSTSSAQGVQIYDNNGKVNYPCIKCNRTFDTQQAFSAHNCSKSQSNSCHDGFICPWCEKEFLALKELNQHVRSCWKGLLTCVICSVNVSGKLGIIKHLQAHKLQSRQPQTRENACLVCGLFDEKWSLTEHWRLHTGVNLLRCVVCKEIVELSRLVEHLNVHRRSDPECAELNWCQQCGLTFRNKAAFNHHRNGHSVRRYTHMCESCGMFFENFQDLEQHILYHVDSNTVHKCSKCKKLYPFRAHYDIHCKTCFKDSGGIQPYTDIGEKYLKIYKTHTLDLVRYAIKQDIVSAASTPKPMQATQAPQNTTHVVVKLRKDDDATLLYICQVCQKKYVGRSSFMRHWREHTGYNPNKCIICSDVFAMPKLLEMHLSVAHSASCYKCTNCSMIFRTVLEHKYHTLAHLKNNTFFCEVCGAGFSEFNYLEYHVFTNHVKECQVKTDQPDPKSAPVANCSTSTEEYQNRVNGVVGNVFESTGSAAKRSYPKRSTNSSAAGNITTTAISGSAVNLQSPVISSSNISTSSATVNQVVAVADPPPVQVKPIATMVSKPANVGVMQQTNTVLGPQISLPELYMCTICKAISSDLPAMMVHAKSHEA